MTASTAHASVSGPSIRVPPHPRPVRLTLSHGLMPRAGPALARNMECGCAGRDCRATVGATQPTTGALALSMVCLRDVHVLSIHLSGAGCSLLPLPSA
jgi:hypothetical protein